jgi:hypothetical protein
MEILIVVLALVGAVVLVVSPFRRGGSAPEAAVRHAERSELEAAKEAKLREIREAELDFRTGKLSEADWQAVDAALRSEAIELLRRLDALSDGRG